MTLPALEKLQAPSVYLPVMAHIQHVRQISQTEKVLTITLPGGLALTHDPGQFVEVSVLGVGEAPISVCSSPSRSQESFELCVRRAGDLTGVIHSLKPGDTLGIRGPFGHGFPVKRFRGKDIIFAPGGLGLAPARSLIQQVLDERHNYGRVIILYGARTPSALLFQEDLTRWQRRDDVEVYISVDHSDENWKGNVGVITTLFSKIQIYARNTVAITVGPPVMYRFVLLELLGLGISEGNIWLSLERRMRCGVGKCGHCQMNHIYTCQEGPVFSYAQIKYLEEAL